VKEEKTNGVEEAMRMLPVQCEEFRRRNRRTALRLPSWTSVVLVK
jgi:hypothetical protein